MVFGNENYAWKKNIKYYAHVFQKNWSIKVTVLLEYLNLLLLTFWARHKSWVLPPEMMDSSNISKETQNIHFVRFQLLHFKQNIKQPFKCFQSQDPMLHSIISKFTNYKNIIY